MFRFRSKTLKAALQEKRNRFAGRTLTARISVPPELRWWYFQEFGTASGLSSDVGAVEDGITIQPVEASPHPEGYSIPPKNGNMLSWPLTAGGNPDYFTFIINGRGYRFFVPWHPGVSPKGFVRRSLLDIRTQTADAFTFALLDSGFDFNTVRETLLSIVMPQVRNIIAANMGESLRGTRDDGKLKGDAAESAFNTLAQIKDLSA
jgi:hypothetical protein